MSESRFGVGLLLVSELKQRFDAGDAIILLDVREDQERSISVIRAPDSVDDLHIPMGQVPAAIEDLRELAASAPVVVYCHHGMRSMTVSRWLVGRGIPGVHNLEGGIEAWSLGVDPTVPRY